LTGLRVLRPATGWIRYGAGVLLVVVAVAVFALIPNSKHKALSTTQSSAFGPVCASSGHLVSVVRVERAAGPDRRAIYRVHCSGGLTTRVAR
jgi:2-methylaconitate cis-trans-isomerase PrpF